MRPSLFQLRDRIAADIETHIEGADAHLRRSNLSVLAAVLAGVADGLYGYVDWVEQQILPDTADSTHLRRWAALWGLEPKPAQSAAGTIDIIGSDGAIVPSGTQFQRSDGKVYTANETVTIADGRATVTATATNPGSDGNAVSGTRLILSSPVAGVNSAAVVATDGIVGGTDQESDASLLDRLLLRLQSPPQGGSLSDYERWALEVQGVNRAWVYPQFYGPGTVGVTFVTDDAVSPIPDAATLDTVAKYIEDRRPVTAEVYVVAPEPMAINPVIAVLPDTEAVRDAIQSELEDFLARESQPGGTILWSHLQEAISRAPGEYDHALIEPTANLNYNGLEFPVLGEIQWKN